MGLGALIAGVPYAPVSAPYSLVAKDFAKLKAIIAVLTPGLVFVDDGVPFAAAIAAAVPADVEIVAKTNPPPTRRATTFDAMLATKAGADVDRAQAKVGPDTIAKLLFTSGSTGTPKGVINTHRMMTSNQAMLRGVNPSYAAEPPVADRLAAVEPHLRRQQQFQSRARQWRLVLHRRGPAAPRRDRSHRPQPE